MNKNGYFSRIQLDGAKVVGAPGGEGVLANFFNSLLHKKSGSSPGAQMAPTSPKPGMPSSPVTPDLAADKAAAHSDAAAELDRLARTKKVPSIDLNSSEC